jgi:hypothetical protein
MKYKSPTSTSRFSLVLSQKTCFNESTIENIWRNKAQYRELEIKQHDPHLNLRKGNQ